MYVQTISTLVRHITKKSEKNPYFFDEKSETGLGFETGQ